MIDALKALLPFILAGALLPTWTVYVILLLGTRRPVANAMGFVAGDIVFRLGLGLMALFGLGPIASVPSVSSSLTRTAAWAYVAIAATAGVLGGWLVRRHDSPDRPEPGWMRRFERMSPAVSFGLGFTTGAAPGIQYAYFLGGLNELLALGMPSPVNLVALVVFVGLLQVMLLVPIVIYATMRSRAARVLDSMKRWIQGHSNRLTGGVLLAVAVYLAARALPVLLAA